MKGKKALTLASITLFLAPGVIGSKEPSVPLAIDPELFQAVIIPKEDKALALITEPHEVTHPTSRPVVVIPAAIAHTPPKPIAKVGKSHSVSGRASWYCRAGRSICRKGYPDTAGADYYAAAGPALRAAIGGVESSTAYKGKLVNVCNGKRCVTVKLVDWCQCHYRDPNIEKVIDLYKDAWDKIVGSGMRRVTITW